MYILPQITKSGQYYLSGVNKEASKALDQDVH